MVEVRKLECVTHGKACRGNVKHAHVFRWVIVK
jgi:hypothetical protein